MIGYRIMILNFGFKKLMVIYAKCSVCCKTLSISGQSKKKWQSHAKSFKHQERLPKDQTQLTFSVKQSAEQQTQPSTSKELKQSTIVSRNAKLHVTHGEISWAVDVVLSYYSFNSSSNKSDLFCRIFPDISMAENFPCGKTKCCYLVSFSVAPYFKLILDDTLSNIDKFVALFGESFNLSSKTGQMDLYVRYWDTTDNCVTTRYYNSEFLGKASAQDMKNLKSSNKLENNRLIHVSSDCPNVYLGFLYILNNKMKWWWTQSIDKCRYMWASPHPQFF